MKLRKLILGAAAAFSAALLCAQEVRVSGYISTGATLAAQAITDSGTGEFEAGDVSAEFGALQNGVQFLNLDAAVPNVELHAGMWLGDGVGPWYGTFMYPDRTSYGDTTDYGALLHMYVVTHFFDSQLNFYSGYLGSNGWTNGYVIGGYVSGGAFVESLAVRGNGEACDAAFTGLELVPDFVSGLRIIAGLPIAPFTDNYSKFNSWEHLFKAVKVMAKYTPSRELSFVAGIRPNTYGTSAERDDYTKSLFGEAFAQAEIGLIPDFPMTFSYDFRWREVSVDAEYMPSGEEWKKNAFAHIAVISTKNSSLVPGWNFAVEDALAFYDSHYVSVNERVFFNRFGISVTHPFAGTPYEFGFQSFFMYGQDANGSSVTGIDSGTSYCSDLVGYQFNFMGAPSASVKGTPGRYIGVYAKPYVQKNFTNGNASLALELNYNRYATTNTTQCISWRIPLGVVFWW